MPDTKAVAPLRILVVDDEANIRTTLSFCLEAEGHVVRSAGTIADALQEIDRGAFDLVFLDVRLGMDNGLDFLPTLRAESPWARVIVITAYASIETAIEAMKRGATDYLPKPFEPAQVQLVTRKVAERRQLEMKLEALQSALGSLDAEADLPTHSPVMREAIDLARQVAASRAPVLIQGEPGTGRGRLARAIHAWSPRADGPFATVSCQTSADALEAELFGNSAVASDAPGASGRIALCDHGSLVLEEIQSAPVPIQIRLNRLLCDREYERAEESRPRPVDVRVIATTSIDLRQAAERGAFRGDLLLALDVVGVSIPPLRSRADDIPLLAERYLALFASQSAAPVNGFTRDAVRALSAYTWPGNVRELRNVIERAVLLCRAEKIGLEHLPPNLLNPTPQYAVGDLVPLEDIERSHVLRVVASTHSLRRAASILGIDTSTVCRWLKRYNAPHEQPAEQALDGIRGIAGDSAGSEHSVGRLSHTV